MGYINVDYNEGEKLVGLQHGEKVNECSRRNPLCRDFWMSRKQLFLLQFAK